MTGMTIVAGDTIKGDARSGIVNMIIDVTIVVHGTMLLLIAIRKRVANRKITKTTRIVQAGVVEENNKNIIIKLVNYELLYITLLSTNLTLSKLQIRKGKFYVIRIWT